MREERLRATAGLRSSPALSSWRGRSGRRYIVGVHPSSSCLKSWKLREAVLLAVRRDRTAPIVVDMATVGPRSERGSAQALAGAGRVARRHRDCTFTAWPMTIANASRCSPTSTK